MNAVDFVDLQRHWDAFGRTDPFWAILTDPNRRGNRWDPAEFFATGREEMTAHFAHAAHLGVPATRRRGLDFGCGAGRLTQAMAIHVDSVVGVDVAPSMIDLARAHNVHGARCVYEVNDRPDLTRFDDRSFDVIYTGRVLQHMEPRYAEGYVREFVRLLAPGGYLSFDLPSEPGFFPESPVAGARPDGAYRAAVRVTKAPTALAPGEAARCAVEVVNTGTHTFGGGEVNVGNHWANADGTTAVRDDVRTGIALPWAPGEVRQVELQVTAPLAAGLYRLQFDVVEEGVMWFADAGSAIADTPVSVGDVPPAAPSSNISVSESDRPEPAMEMHVVPRARIEALLAESGARLLDVRRIHHTGPTFLAFRYDVTK